MQQDPEDKKSIEASAADLPSPNDQTMDMGSLAGAASPDPEDADKTMMMAPNATAIQKPAGDDQTLIMAGGVSAIEGAENASDRHGLQNLTSKTIAGCRLDKKLGEGGMGVVYRAHHLGLDIDVAVKILPPQFSKSDKTIVERFIREARAAARLRHENIVGVQDVGEDDGLYYIIMELVDGQSLQDVLDARGSLPIEEALEIITQALKALVVARKNNIVHRDIKPDNILLTKDGVAKLADLGLAKNEQDDHSMTMTGATMGTPYYISPEQALDTKRADHRSDIYSLGCTLYHMLCGALPYTGQTAYDVVIKHVQEPVPDPVKVNPKLTMAAADLIRRMMAKNPEERFQTAEEALTAIESMFSGTVRITRQPASSASKKYAIAAGVLVLAGIGAIALWPKKTPPAPHTPATPSTTTPATTPVEQPPVATVEPQTATGDEANTATINQLLTSALDEARAIGSATDEMSRVLATLQQTLAHPHVKKADTDLRSELDKLHNELKKDHALLVSFETLAKKADDNASAKDLSAVRSQLAELASKSMGSRAQKEHDRLSKQIATRYHRAYFSEALEQARTLAKQPGQLSQAVRQLETLKTYKTKVPAELFVQAESLLRNCQEKQEALTKRRTRFENLLSQTDQLIQKDPELALLKLSDAETLGKADTRRGYPDLLEEFGSSIASRKALITRARKKREEDEKAARSSNGSAGNLAAFTAAFAVAQVAEGKKDWAQVIAALDTPMKVLGKANHPMKQAAVELLQKAKAAHQKEQAFAAALQKADTLLAAKKYEEAKQAYTQAKTLWPEAPQIARVNKGLDSATDGLLDKLEEGTGSAAIKALRKRARTGDVNAMRELAQAYETGKDIQQNYQLALRWYAKAATKFNLEAMVGQARLIGQGLGATQDRKKAFFLYYDAAERGHSGAWIELAECYIHGWGTEKDPQMARQILQAAADNGTAIAQRILGEGIERGAFGKANPKEARIWYEAAASQDDPIANVRLGDLYRDGKGVAVSAEKAVAYYSIAAETGSAFGKARLAAHLLSGKGIPADPARAVKLLEESAAAHCSSGIQLLANCLRDGTGIAKNPARADALRKDAARFDDQGRRINPEAGDTSGNGLDLQKTLIGR